MQHLLRPISVILAIFAITVILNGSIGAQCSTNFNPGYRAVNKLNQNNGSAFQLNDWNGDGRNDFWYFKLNPDNSTFSIVIYPSLAAGYWDWLNPIGLQASIPSGQIGGTSYIVKDFDGDGLIDIILDKVYRNTGTALAPLQTPVITSPAPTVYINVGYYDIDGDGKLDWVYSAQLPNNVSELRYQPWTASGTFGTKVTLLTGTWTDFSDPKYVSFVDINGDGKNDIFIHSGSSSTGNFRVMLNQGSGSYTTGTSNAFNAYYVGITKDMNNDGRADFVSYYLGKLVVLYGQSDGTLSRTEYSSIPYVGVNNPSADINGDGYADLLTFDNYTTGMGYAGYTMILNNGSSGGFTATSVQKRLRILMGVNGVVLEDVNGDGKADLYESAAAARASSPLNANTYGESVFVVYENQCQPRSLPADSFANDNTPDIINWNASTGTWAWRNWDDVSSNTIAWGTNGDIPSPGDFDGDGRLDPTVFRPSTGQWFALLSGTNTWYSLQFGASGDVPVPNDYDGDGLTDIAVYRKSEGIWYFWYTGTQAFGAYRFGAAEDKPVPADYDGDGKADIGLFRPSDGYWYTINSSNGGFGAVRYGLGTDTPVPADYDGDGKADRAVFRSGTWYILRSLNNASTGIVWGAPDDVLIPFNRTGYSSTPTVFRPSENRWYDFKYLYYSQFGGGTPVKIGSPNY